jgi:hypothetical protein
MDQQRSWRMGCPQNQSSELSLQSGMSGKLRVARFIGQHRSIVHVIGWRATKSMLSWWMLWWMQALGGDYGERLEQAYGTRRGEPPGEGRYADGRPYLQVDGKGTRQWTFRFQIGGRRFDGGGLMQFLRRAKDRRAGCDGGRAHRSSCDGIAGCRAAAARRGERRQSPFRAIAEATVPPGSGWRTIHRAQWRTTSSLMRARSWTRTL